MERSTESGNTRGELYARARLLEAEAIEAGEDGSTGRTLRAQAAELRRRALGERVYPILTCSACYHLTGWVDANGACDECARRAQREAAYSDPHAGWMSVADTREPAERPPRPPFAARLAALAGLRGWLERAIAKAWLARVDPDDTGPIDPEAGYELEAAQRDELIAADAAGFVIRFSSATHRFDGESWLRLDTTRIGRWDTLTPDEFSAGLPIEQLAEAWGDFGAEVAAFNRDAWRRESERREAARQSRAAGQDAVRDQQGVAELLDDGS